MGLRSWIARRFERRSNPLGAGFVPPAPVLSGTFVTPQSALALIAYYSAINVISRDLACLPLNIYRRLPGGGRQVDEDHPYHELLGCETDGDTSSLKFTLDTSGHTLGWGNSYSEIVRDDKGLATDLHILHPSKTLAKLTDAGKLFYEDETSHQKYRAENVLHFAGLGFNGIQGYTPAFIARQGIGLGIAAEQFGAAFFGNGLIPKGVLTTAKKLGTAAINNLRSSIGQVHQGSQSAHQLMILEEGMTWTATQVNPDDAQFIATRQFQVLEIARLFGLPPHKIGDYSQAHHTNVEESNLDYISTTLLFWVVLREHELNRKMLTRDDRKKWVIAHDFSRLLQGNSVARIAYYQGMRNMGCFSADDILAAEGRNPIGSKKGGDKYLVQMQYQPLERAGEPPIALKTPKDPQTSPTRKRGILRYNPNHNPDGRFGAGSVDPIARAGDLGHQLADDPDPVAKLAQEYPRAHEADPDWQSTARDEHESVLESQKGELDELAKDHKASVRDFDKEQAGEVKQLDKDQKGEAKELERDQAHELKDLDKEHQAQLKDLDKDQAKERKDWEEEKPDEREGHQDFKARLESERQDLVENQADDKASLLEEHAGQKQSLLEEHAQQRAEHLEQLAEARKDLLEGHAEEKQGLIADLADQRKEFIADKALELHALEGELESE
jgi:HK97 family phage portal protein